MFNLVTSDRYLLPTVFSSAADIANPEFLLVVVGPGLVSTSAAFLRSSASHPAGPHGQLAKTKHREVSTQFAQKFAKPLRQRLGSVVWSRVFCPSGVSSNGYSLFL